LMLCFFLPAAFDHAAAPAAAFYRLPPRLALQAPTPLNQATKAALKALLNAYVNYFGT